MRKELHRRRDASEKHASATFNEKRKIVGRELRLANTRALEVRTGRLKIFNQPALLDSHETSHFCVYFSLVPLFTAGRSAIRSIHFSRCGKGFISSSLNPLNAQPLTQGQVPISATEYLPLPLPAR